MSKRITNVKSGKGGKKALAIIAIALVVIIVGGIVAAFSIADSGMIQRNQIAMKSENYEISAAMMSYFFNQTYQGNAESYSTYYKLDTSKPLASQPCALTNGTSTWYDFIMTETKNSARQVLVLCEAAKAAGFKVENVEGHDHSADETLKSYEQVAAMYGATLDQYLEASFGKGVNEKVFRQCFELSELANHYYEHLMESYTFTEADWDKYYGENKDSFNKVDYLSYTFKVTKETVDANATDDEKAAAEARDKEEAARLEQLAIALGATVTEEQFLTYVEGYLRNDLYKDKTEDQLKEDKVDIEELVEDCKTTGAQNSQTTDLNKWLFDAATVANTTKVIKSEDGYSFTVAMILPAAGTDLEDDCLYRDTYHLKNFRYIPFLTSSFKDSAADAKEAADAALLTFQDDPTAENFAKMADEYGNTGYEGGLVEGADKGQIGDEGDAWLYDSARKEGDCAVIEVPDKGSYLVYYVGDNEIKWQYQANNALRNDKYTEEYSALEAQFTVKTVKKGLDLVPDIQVAG
ncbi:MAG: hypothetical protein IJD22_04530 [Clostridia bacterium]|nr:hypothetical protein [Clostridia bacterium]